MGSPPKPWERATTAVASSSPSLPQQDLSSNPPDRPPAFSGPAASSTAVATTGVSPYTASPYSRLGYNSYGGYSGLGSFGGMYGGYGGYNSPYSMGYGSMGMGYGGYNSMGYGAGLGFPPGAPMLDAAGNPIPSLSQSLETTTAHTFQLLHSIVQTFTGLAQMLESTFMATHSSFFAMVGVVEQFGILRNALGSVLGLFGLVRWLKELITGRQAAAPMRHEFRQFLDGKPVQGPLPQGVAPQVKPSKKPLIIFLLAIFGVPYAMTKLIKVLNERALEQQKQLGIAPGTLSPLTPSELTFARAIYPFNATTPAELELKKDEIVAVMGKLDPRTGQEVDPRIQIPVTDGQTDGEQWWKGRTRDGREGWFPKKWVQVLERKGQEAKSVD